MALPEGQRFDEDAVAGAASGRGDPTKRLGQEGVRGDLLGRLTQHKPQAPAGAGCEMTGRCIRVVAELLGSDADAQPRGGRDRHIRAVVEDE